MYISQNKFMIIILHLFPSGNQLVHYKRRTILCVTQPGLEKDLNFSLPFGQAPQARQHFLLVLVNDFI